MIRNAHVVKLECTSPYFVCVSNPIYNVAGHIEGNCFSSIFLLSLSCNSQELQCWFQIFYTLSVGYRRLLLFSD